MKLAAKLSGILLTGLLLLYVCFLVAKVSLGSLFLGVGLGVVLIGALVFEYRLSKEVLFEGSVFIKMSAVFIASILTYYISKYTDIVVAASLVGIIGAMLFGDLDDPIYVGAFVGMATLFTNIHVFIGVAVLASFLYILLENHFIDMGGKLGTIAFMGGLIVSFFSTYTRNPIILENYQIVILMGVSTLSALLTFYLAKYFENTILASAFVGLTLGVVALFVDLSFVDVIALVGYGATFIGCQKRYKPYYMLISSVLFVVIYKYLYVVGGIGGGLGMSAFLSLMPVALGHHLYNYFNKKPINTNSKQHKTVKID